MPDVPLIAYFTYYPPHTEQRQQAHDEINAAAYKFAEVIDKFVENEDCKKMAMFAVQQARMFANQGATIDELRKGGY